MADVKISQLPFTSTICNTALVPIVQNGMTCSAYVCDIVPPSTSIIVPSTGCNSSIRCGVGHTVSGAYSTAIGGSTNCNTGINSIVSGGTINIIGCYNLAGATCLTTSSYVYCVNASTNSVYFYGDYTADLQVGNCLAYFNCYDNKTYSGIITCSTYSGSYTEVKGICAGTTSGNICLPFRNMSCVCGTPSLHSQINVGYANTNAGCFSSISGGYDNHISATSTASIIGGGCKNLNQGGCSVIAAGQANTITSSGFYSFIGTSNNSCTSGLGTFIGSGQSHNISSTFSTIVNGSTNTISGYGSASMIGSGYQNTITGARSFIGAGDSNNISSCLSFIGGGQQNIVSACWSTLGGGLRNTVSSCNSGILGGQCNNTSTFANTMIVGSCITADRACATFVNNLSIKNIPTSSAGLPAGSVWSNSGVLTIV